jgi:uncharacterized LabA/DUF88 family protein
VLKRVIAFVDGENLVLRYQEMLRAGRRPRGDVFHIPNRFVWAAGMTLWTRMDLSRVNYYMSIDGARENVEELSHQIAEQTFTCQGEVYLQGTARILPHIHWKSAQSRKTKVIDIHLTVDAMRAVTTMPVDGIFLVSGDGDYDQLLAEVGRSGKQAYLAAFSSGLDPKLKTRVEQFVDLDDVYFLPP